jgi:hypothetical protein
MSVSRPDRFTPRGRMARYLSSRRLGELRSPSERFGKGINFLPLLGIELRSLGRLAISLLTTAMQK